MTLIDSEKAITIVVNARQKTIAEADLTRDGEISYQQVLALASDTPGWLRPGPNIEYTVSYRNALSRPDSGDLLEGQTVKIQDGTVFNATATDKS